MRNVITRKEAREVEILRLLAGEPTGKSNHDLMGILGLPYPAVRAATSELAVEGKLWGRVIGNGRYGYI
jgi:DNA-binding IclR family transcriptional regulator